MKLKLHNKYGAAVVVRCLDKKTVILRSGETCEISIKNETEIDYYRNSYARLGITFSYSVDKVEEPKVEEPKVEKKPARRSAKKVEEPKVEESTVVEEPAKEEVPAEPVEESKEDEKLPESSVEEPVEKAE